METLIIGDSVKVIQYAAFENCENLKTVTIGLSVDSLAGDYWGNGVPFNNCNNIETLYYNAKHLKYYGQSIDKGGFKSKGSLKMVTIGGSVEQLPDGFVYNCGNIEKIISYAEDVPTAKSNTFYNVKNNIPVIVPCVSKADYKTADYWKNFTDIQSKTYSTSVSMALCYGEAFNNNIATKSGIVVDTLQSITGCDSIVTTDLTVYPTYDTTLYMTTVVDEKGEDYYDTVTNELQSVHGCDSAVTVITLYDYDNSVDKVYKDITVAICQGSQYIFDNKPLTAAGTYTQTVNVNKYRDSIVNLTLTVNPVYEKNLTETICKGQTYDKNGFNTNQAGVHVQNLSTINGCDSTVALTLNVVDGFDTTVTIEVCSDSVFAGTFVQELTSQAGCDSIVRINMTAKTGDNPVDTVYITDTLKLYDTVTVVDTVTNTVIQKDTVTLTDTVMLTEYIHDTITNIVHDTTIVTQIDTLTLHDTITNTITLYDTVTLHDTTILTQIDTVTLHDTITNEITLYDTVTLTDTLYVYDTVKLCAVVRTYIYATINTGENYSDYGFDVSEAGTHTQILQTEDGCDSIITLYLQVTQGIDEIQQDKIITVYPNPAKDKVTIKADGDVTIFNSKGQTVKTIKNINGVKEINIADLESGVYYVKVGETTKKLIVK